MRFATAALIPALVLSVALSASAADPKPSPGGAKAPSDIPLDVAKRKLDDIEKTLRAPQTAGEPSRAELTRACRSSFTVTAMAGAVRGWMVQGSPERGVLTGKTEFPEFSQKVLGEVVPMLQRYQTCLARATGQRVCEPMELLGLPHDSHSGPMCGEPKGQERPFSLGPDDMFVSSMASGNRAAARGYCLNAAAQFPLVAGAADATCDAMIADYGNPAAACARLKPKLPGPAPADFDVQCLHGAGSLMGDAKVCAVLKGQPKASCQRRAQIRAGTYKAAQSSSDRTCEQPIDKLREWYCGRFSWPVFERMSAKNRKAALQAVQGQRADARARARTELKEVNDLLAEVVSAQQMGPLTGQQKELLDSLSERRDRVTRQLNDGRAPAPTKGRRSR